MTVIFYISVTVAILGAVLVVTRQNAVHALLYLVASLLALAVAFFALGAPFAAALEVIIYAGAIMVLFVIVIMTFNLRPPALASENQRLEFGGWAGPALLVTILAVEVIYILAGPPGPLSAGAAASNQPIDPKQIGAALFGPYMLAVELASLLLLAGLVGAYHLGQREIAERPDASAALADPDIKVAGQSPLPLGDLVPPVAEVGEQR